MNNSDATEIMKSEKFSDECKNDDKNGKEERITSRQDLTRYFGKTDHSINKVHCSEVRSLINPSNLSLK